MGVPFRAMRIADPVEACVGKMHLFMDPGKYGQVLLVFMTVVGREPVKVGENFLSGSEWGSPGCFNPPE
jgi:hypothetical protein